MTLTSTTIANFGKPTTVKVGDTVGFKSDYEQYGKIIKIEQVDRWSPVMLTLENPAGFGGEYLRYAKRTVEAADDCWV